jgi:Dynamin family
VALEVTGRSTVREEVAAMSGALSPAVAEACAALRPQLQPDSAGKIGHVLTRLDGPLQVAVAGRIKSGKSTLVNALIGRRVAPTDVRECTRLVTRFQYGTVDRVEVVAVDGTRRTVPYDNDGLVPTDLGTEPDKIAYLDAFLTSATLRGLTVIDTPGLGSLDRASSRRTEVLLGAGGGAPVAVDEVAAEPGVDAGSRAAVAQAEAVLYVLTQSARADDAAALAVFGAYSVPQASGPINALGVLTKADQVVPAGSEDEWTAALWLAASQAAALRNKVWDVLPLVGIVAEHTGTGGFTEADADTLRQIAALSADQRELMFLAADLFVGPELAVPVAARARLLERLGLYGARRAVDLLAADPALTAGELRRRLADMSGFPAVRDMLESTFRRRADGIKANVALAALEVVAAQAAPADRLRIRDAIEDLTARPEAHLLRLLEVATLVSSGEVTLPPELDAELSRLVGDPEPAAQLGLPAGAPVDALRAAALDAAGRWRSFATFGSNPAQSRVAHVVHRGFFLLWQRLGGPA